MWDQFPKCIHGRGVLFEQPIWLTTYTTTIIYKEKVGICTETKALLSKRKCGAATPKIAGAISVTRTLIYLILKYYTVKKNY